MIGTGVALNMDDLFEELDGLKARGVAEPSVRVSNRAQLLLPYHKLFDVLEEERLGDNKFGSTKSGIAPFYADKAAKLGIQVADLYEEERLRERLSASLAAKNVLLEHLYKRPPIDADALIDSLLDAGKRLRPYVCDTSQLLQDAVRRGDSILVEGQLGALRDPTTESILTLPLLPRLLVMHPLVQAFPRMRLTASLLLRRLIPAP